MNEHVDIAIIGSGFAGIGAAVRLKQAGIDDFVVLERADDVGGTWRDNTYPGCACDVPSHLYSFSFAPEPGVDAHVLAAARDLRPTCGACADELRRDAAHPLRRARSSTPRWDEDAAALAARDRRAATLTARVPDRRHRARCASRRCPTCPASTTSRARSSTPRGGTTTHDLDGERVAVIGTGASAIQFVPQIQPEVRELHLFQRTPPWVMPRFDRDRSRRSSSVLYRRCRSPSARARGRSTGPARRSSSACPASRGCSGACSGWRKRIISRSGRATASCAAKLTPSYTIGCKRILISNDYLPGARQAERRAGRPTASREVRGNVVVGADGTEREVDTIIFGTGFHVTDLPDRRARPRRATAARWPRPGTAACRRIAARRSPASPTCFFLVGPNTGLGHNSIVFMIESQLQLRRSTRCARMERERRAPRRGRRRTRRPRYNERDPARDARDGLDARRLRELVPRRQGRNTTLWPGFTFRFRELTKSFDREHYELRSAPVREEIYA